MITKFEWEVKGHRNDGTFFETTIESTLKAGEICKKIESCGIIIDSLIKIRVIGYYTSLSDLVQDKKERKICANTVSF